MSYILFIIGKEARKKELKKNKRQRQMVRAAVLKMKDPVQIFEELEKIDEMGIVKDPTIYNKRFENRIRIIVSFC